MAFIDVLRILGRTRMVIVFIITLLVLIVFFKSELKPFIDFLVDEIKGNLNIGG